MTNLLQETIEEIKESGHTTHDIFFIGSDCGKYRCTWEEFKLLADHEYDAGYGSQEVASDLIILFNNNDRLFRYEYDGSENWAWQPSFDRENIEGKPIISLFPNLGGCIGEGE